MAIIGEPIKKYVAIPINEPMPEDHPQAVPEREVPSPSSTPPLRKPEEVEQEA